MAVEEMLACAVSKGDRRIAYIASTYQQARDIAWEMLKAKALPVATKINESRLEITVQTQDGGSSLIILRGWESVETLRGQYFDFLVLDEVAMYRNFMTGWQEVLRPTLTDKKGSVLFISTPKGFNHWYEIFNIQASDGDYKSFQFSSYDNPFLPKEELDKAKQEMTEDRFAQEYMADFRKMEGLVYKEFDRTKHLFDTDPTRVVETIAGVDFGTTNPAAEITIKKDYDQNYWVTSEWYERGKTDAEIAEHVSGTPYNKVYADPESASGNLELKKRGVNCRDVVKNKDSVRNGINAVRELFRTGKLKIHVSCQNLIWELETYSYPEKKDQHNPEENPIKENDHALDALRYAIMMNINDHRQVATQYFPKAKTYGQTNTKSAGLFLAGSIKG